MRIKDKGVNCPSHCVLCNYGEEDSFHLFFRCPSGSNIWSMCDGCTRMGNVINHGQDCAGIIFNMLQVLCADEVALFLLHFVEYLEAKE